VSSFFSAVLTVAKPESFAVTGKIPEYTTIFSSWHAPSIPIYFQLICIPTIRIQILF
jgi:hypothetical protein